MELEFHQLDLRYRDLRIVRPKRLRQLMAELAEAGQQSPVLVTADREPQRYVLIDGYQRVAALKRLGHDLVHAVCLVLSDADALLFCRQRQRSGPSALEDGWLLRELRDTHGLRAAALAVRLSRSPSWISRRLALVEALPISVQALVQKGELCPQAAMKYLVPLARANKSDCEALAKNLADQNVSVRQMHTLYVGWRQSDDESRQRLVQKPMLYLAARAEQKPGERVVHPDAALLSDLHTIEAIMRRLAKRLRDQQNSIATGPAVFEAWSSVQQAFDGLFAYLC
jgi:ParB family chromosome partitioning protein